MIQLLKRLIDFFRSLFLFEKDDISEGEEKPKKKRRKIHRCWGSFKDLKGYIDNVFMELEHADFLDKDGWSINVSKETIRDLRTMGPFMMTMDEDIPPVFEQASLRVKPSFMFLGFPEERINKGDLLSYRFLYAIKIKKGDVKFTVEKTKSSEDIYQIGYALYDDTPPRWARRMGRKLVWMNYYAALDIVTGKSRTLKTIQTVTNKFYQHKIPVKPIDGLAGEDESLARMLNVWIRRDFSWQVQAKKSDNKVTFCIEDNMAKDYFKDREIDDNGKRKRIFHWVKAHYRKTKKGAVTVKTHSRGNREFTWGEYAIRIIIPGKHRLELSQFDLAGELYDDKPPGMLSLGEAHEKLDQIKPNYH